MGQLKRNSRQLLMLRGKLVMDGFNGLAIMARRSTKNLAFSPVLHDAQAFQ
jgi:hypothetical protein